MGEGCSELACARLHPRHAGLPVCGRHATSLLGLWGRRQRPECIGSCGKAHPTAAELESSLVAALPEGSRLHAHVLSPPRFGDDSEGAATSSSLYVVPRDVLPAEADAALAARAPVALRVAIDVGYDAHMSNSERKSLATQCGLCHGIAAQAEHRPHVALAICCGTPASGEEEEMAESAAAGLAAATLQDEGDGEAGASSLALLRAAGLETWRPLTSQASGGGLLSLLSLPGAERQSIVYLSPEAPDVLGTLLPSEVYVIGGLVDKLKIAGASYRRAAALGVRCARLPLLENLPKALRGRSNALDALNLNCVFRLLVEWSKSRDWTAAIATAFEGSQRLRASLGDGGSGKADDGHIHPNGYWDGPFAASQHQYDPLLSGALVAFFAAEGARTVVDLGCGMGSYVRHFNKHGLHAAGFDGNPFTPQLSRGTCAVLDLSVVIDVVTPHDWAVSLEVGEHLPKQHEDAFLENLHRHNAHGLVLSWARKGQGGTGHVNEQNNDYVKAKVCAMGYVNDVEAETTLRKASKLSYFKHTIMVFRRVAEAR